MSKVNGGGPAFPSAGTVTPDGVLFEGISARDYFAARAMQGIVSAHTESCAGDVRDGSGDVTKTQCWGDNTGLEWNETAQRFYGAEATARAAYIIADAMLAAREAK